VNATQGTSLIGSRRAQGGERTFHAVNPATGEKLSPAYHVARREDIDAACALAYDAFATFSRVPGRKRAEFLRKIAERIEAIGPALVETAMLETEIPVGRLHGETGRTCGQLRLFAQVLEEGSWVEARIDTADPNRKPQRRQFFSGNHAQACPGAVFSASNFPLAFSVAGGDTASALAAGNPVIVKAHAAHPGTSELIGAAVQESVREHGLPEGTFSMLYDAGIDIGTELVRHPSIKAVGFTGSRAGGQALLKAASQRAEPIPFYAEMSSVNPVFILPGALRERLDQIASGLAASFTLGSGQFCTKPGIVFLKQGGDAQRFTEKLAEHIVASEAFTLLTAGIYASFKQGAAARNANKLADGKLAAAEGYRVSAVAFETEAHKLAEDPTLAEELFGPSTLVAKYSNDSELLDVARNLEGHLTATVHGTAQDLLENAELLRILETKVGRVIINGFPTGVEVSHAMVHGGPYPATSDMRTTSVGSQAIFRFARPVCYQGFSEELLPEELRNPNPLGIWRMVDGAITCDPLT
jgi:NADP-dependent aldehyde dehydrogenase